MGAVITIYNLNLQGIKIRIINGRTLSGRGDDFGCADFLVVVMLLF